MLKHIQRRARRLVRGLEHKPLQRVAEGAGIVYSGEKESRGDLVTLYNCLKGGVDR